MKKAVLFIMGLNLILLSGLFAQSNPNAILGKWKNPTGGKTIEIYRQKDLYYGKIIECTDHEVAIGTMILKDFTFISAGNRWEGIVFVPKQGKDLDGTLVLKDDKTLVIEVSIGFMTRSKEWTRVVKQ